MARRKKCRFMNEQNVRLQIVEALIRAGVSVSVIMDYAEKLVKFVLSGEREQDSSTSFTKIALESPLRIKVNASTGIPAEFGS